ncbi:hypothetical protein [Streptomyces acidicola]|uniref:hypothetical protein n=1 Tax=Streptomyces acidicola TaxID=2596892 RepID=UPI003826F5F6
MLRKLVEGQLLRMEGNAFEECMDRLGLELRPGDYQPLRAAGPKGDTKNDGYCPKARVFPRRRSAVFLEGCLQEHRDVDVWRFLTNDMLPGEVDHRMACNQGPGALQSGSRCSAGSLLIPVCHRAGGLCRLFVGDM